MPLARVAVFVAAAALAAVGLSGHSRQPSSPAQLQKTAVGAYRFADGKVVALFVQPFGRSMRIIDYDNGSMRQLKQISRDGFVGGPRLLTTRPVRVRVQLVRNAAGQVIAIRRNGVRATRIPLPVVPATFASSGARIAGKLMRPAGAGPFPAVVLVPGAVKATRDTYDLWSLFFASHGFAVLSHDKRGIGKSTGSFDDNPTDANLQLLAGDELAAVAWLRQRAEIDPRRIGLSGGSQAGWVVPLAASQSAEVAFAALQSGPAMSVGRQRAYAALTVNGDRVPPPTEAEIHALDGCCDIGFDPKPAIGALRIPTLWQYGSVDKRQYTPESLAILRDIAPDATIRVYAGGAHSLRKTVNGLITEERDTTGFVAGLFSDLAAWLSLRAAP
jgi:dienelactone hydrolase